MLYYFNQSIVETFYILVQSDFTLIDFSQLFESHALKAGRNELGISEHAFIQAVLLMSVFEQRLSFRML